MDTVAQVCTGITAVILIAVFLVIEMLTLDFTFLMLSFGAAVGLVTDVVGLPFWVQVIIAAGAAALSLNVMPSSCLGVAVSRTGGASPAGRGRPGRR